MPHYGPLPLPAHRPASEVQEGAHRELGRHPPGDMGRLPREDVTKSWCAMAPRPAVEPSHAVPSAHSGCARSVTGGELSALTRLHSPELFNPQILKKRCLVFFGSEVLTSIQTRRQGNLAFGGKY